MNDREREQWIDNDEGLYNWARSSRLRRAEFIRQNRAELDAIIERALAPREPRDYTESGRGWAR